MQETGEMTRRKVLGDLFGQILEKNIVVNGALTNLTAKEFIRGIQL
jgi:hypothetical protein